MNITKKNADTLVETAKKLNKKAIKNTDELVDNGLQAAAQWQDVAEKALKTGTTIMARQQDVLFYALEGVKNQTIKSVKRLQDLVSIKLPKPPTTKLMKKKEVAEVAKVSKKVIASTKKEAAKTTVKISKAADNRIAATKAKAAVKPTTKPTVDDLKVIDGIGPKMEQVLNGAGIDSFGKLATAKSEDLKKYLADVSPRYKMFEPQEWIDTASKLVKK